MSIMTTSDMIEFAVRCKVSEPLSFTLPLPGKPGLTRVDLEQTGVAKSPAERESVGHLISTLKEVRLDKYGRDISHRVCSWIHR